MKTILVIDDSEDVRSFITTTMTQAGFSTLEAADAARGVELAKSSRPDLILCDIRMPGMDGYAALSTIRELPGIAGVPFILMTGSPDRDGFRRGMTGGADDFLWKPFSADELVQAVISRLVRHGELEWENCERADKLRHEAVDELSRELSVPLNGLLGAITSIMVDYAAMNPEGAYTTARQINESAARINELAQAWAA
jgi:CheY-like chemotaxis protein